MSRGNEPAYPFVCADIAKTQAHEPGLTIRELAAIAAMKGLLAMYASFDKTPKPEVAAADAVAYADALIAEFDKEEKKDHGQAPRSA